MPTSTLILKRSEFQIMIRDIEQTFWKTEDVHVTENDKEHFFKLHRRLKINFIILALQCIGLLVFHGLAFKAKELIYPIYQPSWLGVNEILMLETFVPIFSQIIPMMALINLFSSVIVLTQIQFRMLNKEILYHFMTMNIEVSSEIIKKIIDHHNFLLRYSFKLYLSNSYKIFIS